MGQRPNRKVPALKLNVGAMTEFFNRIEKRIRHPLEDCLDKLTSENLVRLKAEKKGEQAPNINVVESRRAGNSSCS
jgi:hypothetical protein